MVYLAPQFHMPRLVSPHQLRRLLRPESCDLITISESDPPIDFVEAREWLCRSYYFFEED
jgi:hypothetical protein